MDKSPGGGRSTGKSSTGSSSSGDLVKEQVSQGAQQVQQAASHVAQGATHQAESFAESRKNQAAQSLKTVAESLRKTGQELDKKGEKMAGTAIDKVADGTDSVAGYLQNESIGQMVGDVENFARDNTWAFLGGAFVVGLAAARFLKSSTPPSPQASGYGSRSSYGSSSSGYGAPGYGGTRYQGTPYGGSLSGTGAGGQLGARADEYDGVGSGLTEGSAGTRGPRTGRASGMTEGNDGTTI